MALGGKCPICSYDVEDDTDSSAESGVEEQGAREWKREE
jgi:hypothetical protein